MTSSWYTITLNFRLGIEESLTGRIGILHLHPMTLAEAHTKPLLSLSPLAALSSRLARFDISEFSLGMQRGGLPFPLFLRDRNGAKLFWDSWLETSVHRDVARFFKSSFDARIVFKILRKFKEAALRGENFSASLVDGIQARRLKHYLTAMEDIFLIRRLSCHDLGVGKDQWILFDSGLLSYLMTDQNSEGATLSLARTFLINELSAQCEYSNERLDLIYYKSTKGRPIDLIWKNLPLKLISQSNLKGIGWEERALAGAMKTLGATQGFLAAPIERPILSKKGISVVAWSWWS